MSSLNNFKSVDISYGLFNPDTSEQVTVDSSHASFTVSGPGAPAPGIGTGLLSGTVACLTLLMMRRRSAARLRRRPAYA